MSGWSRSLVARWAGALYLAYVVANVIAESAGKHRTERHPSAADHDHGPGDVVPARAGRGNRLGPAVRAHRMGPLHPAPRRQRTTCPAPACPQRSRSGSPVRQRPAPPPSRSSPAVRPKGSPAPNSMTSRCWRSPCTTQVSSPHNCSSPPGCSRWAGWSCASVQPRFLGWLLLLDAVGVSFWFLQAFLAPGHPGLSYPSWAVGFIAEVGFALWLVIKGVSPDERHDAAPGRNR